MSKNTYDYLIPKYIKNFTWQNYMCSI
jgi:hypothetical protein